jgi:hypothetical protein
VHKRAAYIPPALAAFAFSFLRVWGIFKKKFIPVYRYMRDRGVIIKG